MTGPLTLIDIVAAIAGAAASGWLAIRAYMLKPAHPAWCDAPARVWWSLLGLSITAGISALSILRGGGHATAREALHLIMLGVTALVMLENLNRQAPPRS
jgi:hypothetical protein